MSMTNGNGIRLGDAGSRGRGVFAARRFRKGELIECAPVIVIPGRQWKPLSKTILFHYVFCWGLGDTALALGLGSFYNHSETPNAETAEQIERGVIEFLARRTIQKGEEITIDYTGGEPGARLWFKPAAPG